MPDAPPPPPQRSRGLWIFLFCLGGALILMMVTVKTWTTSTPNWSQFMEDIKKGQVAAVSAGLASDYVLVELDRTKTTQKDQIYKVYWPGDPRTANEEMLAAINAYNNSGQGTIVRKSLPPPSMLEQMLPSLILVTVLVSLFYFLVIRRMSQGGGVLSFGKSRAQLIGKGKTGKTFKDVAGIDEAKEEVEELVAFLKNPKKFQKLGGRIPKGVLLVGPPGTGKTLLAKAIAGEADVPFYSISGSDFVEMFVGVGASRVRDLFAQAKDSSPCIIFIDEIDAVGRRRGQGLSTGGHDEREQTLNAILVEMDGFASTDKVIVIAATNRVDVLDPALLRPGRFDRHIHVSLPDIAGREQILQVHAAKVKMAKDADLLVSARGTPGFSGADLESMINEAALHAARNEQEAVTNSDLEYARDRVAFGREKKAGSRAMPERERIITAYHEAGHALLQTQVAEADALHKVTIIPRGRALGATMHLPAEDRHTHSKRKLLGDIAVLFGGRIAEEIFCGDITTGAANDIERATGLARAMVYEWGMSDKMGPLKYTESHDGFGGEESVVAVSAVTRRELDEEVRGVIDRQYAHAHDLIVHHRASVERIAKALLEHETLDAGQVRTLLAGGDLPPRAPTVKLPALTEPEPEKPRTGAAASSELRPATA